MSDRRPPQNDTPPNETPPIDPPRQEAPVSDPSGREPPPRQAPPAEPPDAPVEPPPGDGDRKPRPVERIQKLRLGVRVVWWSAVALTLGFGGVALWMGVGQRDPFFALFYLVLAACCAVAGYGTLVAFRRPSAF